MKAPVRHPCSRLAALHGVPRIAAAVDTAEDVDRSGRHVITIFLLRLLVSSICNSQYDIICTVPANRHTILGLVVSPTLWVARLPQHSGTLINVMLFYSRPPFLSASTEA